MKQNFFQETVLSEILITIVASMMYSCAVIHENVLLSYLKD